MVLSTSSVYPDDAATAFEFAARLGFDGVEVMVGLDPLSSDEDAIERLSQYHGVPVVSVHAPCLLVTQRVWGNDPWAKLARSCRAARRFGAGVVVVHPPFRWQRSYASGFVGGVRRLAAEHGVTIAVENMYPWRLPGGGELAAYRPAWDPLQLDYDHLTLDLSHASTARQSSLALLDSWGERLAHVHLTDGSGGYKDDHLLPGEGDQHADRVLRRLAASGFTGAIVLEVNCNRWESRAERRDALARSLDFIRLHLSDPVASNG